MNVKALSVLMVPLVGLGGGAYWHYHANGSRAAAQAAGASATPSAKSTPRPGGESAAAAPSLRARVASVGLKDTAAVENEPRQTVPAALEQQLISASWRGNGRDKMQVRLTNLSARLLRLEVGAGLVLESAKSAVIIARPVPVDLVPNGSAELAVETLALRSSNKLEPAPYQLTQSQSAALQGLLAFGQEHRELSLAALQTMALALTENLPLSAVSKFTPVAGELQSHFNTDAYRVEVVDIIAALGALRRMGVEESSIAMTIDPQLKIEAMIDPLTRAAAMVYYGITAETEWEYWKSELLNGAPATRHYALYGIARFYPDIALDMLPKWAREPKTLPVYRLSALQALADTRRAEALPVLRELSSELGPQTELGRAARGAAEYLEKRLSSSKGRSDSVVFRAAKDFTRFENESGQ